MKRAEIEKTIADAYETYISFYNSGKFNPLATDENETQEQKDFFKARAFLEALNNLAENYRK